MVFAHKSDFRPSDRSSGCLWTHSKRSLATAVGRAARVVVGHCGSIMSRITHTHTNIYICIQSVKITQCDLT